ncbi:Zn-dependent protease [Salinarchaeum sp. Harcht-Bsk1]|uniref:CBS domain-containing protein n=1 Tax=Salinarchaeum sp. Harcht-Bsk1 TaxID=1333523 RepID=UPI0003423533|nr:CBS domain-containing protein [Salinarchaeum sp. Harcht-Bsk1]AGN00786.1 Zn-dependent protease [Salinarchaeum sp. Harcht-Bsk1]
MPSFRIGSAFGVPVKLDLTFLLVLPLFAYIIGSRIESTAELFNDVLGAGLSVNALTGGATPWLIGVVAAVGLFACVLAHEFGHSLVAMHYGFPIDSITLWIFGGIASLSELPEDWKQELQIAIAGPAVSVAIGIGAYALSTVVPAGNDQVTYVLLYLGVLNVALAVFNLLPAFPMDGGRVLRALLGRTRSFAEATRIAANVGKWLAILMGLLGLFRLDIILVGIAFFVYIAAAGEAQQVITKAAFEGVQVQDVMTPVDRLHVVSPDVSVTELLQRMVRERHTGYPVIENGEPVGVVTLGDAREVREVERDAYEVREIMSTDLVTIAPDGEAMTALTRMQEHGVGRLLVVDDGMLVGLLSRSDLMAALDVLREGGELAESATAGRPPVDRPT